VYGFINREVAIIASNALSLTLSGLLLFFKFKFG